MKKTTSYFNINGVSIETKPLLLLPYNPNLKLRARELRKARNLPEVLFWMQVTKNRFHQIDFDRQRVIGNFIVDFYVKKLGLVIEIDGSSHDHTIDYDQARENFLRSLGLNVYRIKVRDILSNIALVMAALEEYIILHYSVYEKVQPPRPQADTPPEEGN